MNQESCVSCTYVYNISRLWPKNQPLSRTSLWIADQWDKTLLLRSLMITEYKTPTLNPAQIQLSWNILPCLCDPTQTVNVKTEMQVIGFYHYLITNVCQKISGPGNMILLTGKWIESANYHFCHLEIEYICPS